MIHLVTQVLALTKLTESCPESLKNGPNFTNALFIRIKNVVKLEAKKKALSPNQSPYLNLFKSILTMKLTRYFCILFTASAAVFLMACGKSGSDKEKESDAFSKAQESIKSEIEELSRAIPDPSEIPYILQSTGADYNASLLNPTSKADSYLGRSDKVALNLGVYATDIGYLSSYEKTQEAVDYMHTCKQLADNLNIIGTFDESLVRRFEANISNKDSLASLLNATVDKTEAFLTNDNRTELAAQVIAGSFIEGLYISTGLVKSYPKDILPNDSRNLILTPIIRNILEQKNSVSQVRKMLATVEQTNEIAAISSDLQQLEEVYGKLNIEEQIRNNRADLLLSDENLVEITAIVERIRNRITG
jgi:hypothetical protein